MAAIISTSRRGTAPVRASMASFNTSGRSGSSAAIAWRASAAVDTARVARGRTYQRRYHGSRARSPSATTARGASNTRTFRRTTERDAPGARETRGASREQAAARTRSAAAGVRRTACPYHAVSRRHKVWSRARGEVDGAGAVRLQHLHLVRVRDGVRAARRRSGDADPDAAEHDLISRNRHVAVREGALELVVQQGPHGARGDGADCSEIEYLDGKIVGKGDRKVRVRDGQRRIAHEVETHLQREPVRILVVLGEAVY